MKFLFGKKEEDTKQEEPVLPKVYEGSVCEIKTEANELIAAGSIGEIADDFIRIDNRTMPFPLQTFGTHLKISIFNSKEGFRVVVGKVYAASTAFIKLIECINLLDYERRNFFRISVEKPAWISEQTEEEDGWIDTHRVLLRDLSLGGLLMEYPKKGRTDSRQSEEASEEDWKKADAFFCEGRHFFLRLKLGRFNQVVECVVCRRLEPEDGRLLYGCAFCKLSNAQSDAVCQYIFQIQREQIQQHQSTVGLP